MSEKIFVNCGGIEVATDPLTVACHNYAVQKLKEKFGPTGHCTMMDYVVFYGEKLKELQNGQRELEEPTATP